MSIATRIQSMYDNVEDVYDTITNVTLPAHKNIENIPQTIRDSYLEIMNNGIDVVWSNWEKVTGTGTTLTLNNTEHAPMSLVYKGDTYQNTAPGKNLFNKNNIAYDMLYIYENQQAGETRIVASESTYCVYVPIQTTGVKYTISGLTKSYNVAIMKAQPVVDGGDDVLTWTQSSKTGAYTTYSAVPSNCTYLALFFELGNSTLAEVVDSLQIEQGDTATSYEPYSNGPSPTSPRGIHVVSGDNSIEVSNGDNTQSASYPINLGIKNLFNKNTVSSGYRLDSLGNLYADASYFASDFIEVRPNTQYKTNIEPTSYKRMCEYDLNKTYLGGKDNQGVNTITTSSSTFYIKISGLLTELDGTKVAKGATTDSISDNPIELNKIGTYQDYIRKSTGKNLFDISNYQNLPTTYEYTINSYSCKKIQLEPNKTYTISHNASSSSSIVALLNNVQAINASGYYDLRNASGSKSFTTDSTGCLYIGVLVSTSDTDYNNRVNSCFIVINEGTTALSYEPYGTNWYLKKEIGKVVLDGSENSGGISSGNSGRFDIPLSDAALGSSTNNPVLSDRFQSRFATTNYSIFLSGVYHQLGIMYTDINWDTTTWKTWLSNNNTTVYYALATPTYETITDTTLIGQLETLKKSYEGQTNISQTNNDLPFELNVTALSDGTV